MSGAVDATIQLDGATLHTLTRPPGGLASDALAALKTDTGAFLTAHMAAAGAAPDAGEEVNMLEEEVSAGEDDGDAARRPAHTKRKRGGK